MEKKLVLKGEYITLGQLLKAEGLAESGSDAKAIIQNGEVKVNGEKEIRRGRKLHEGDEVSFHDTVVKVVR